MAARKFAFLVHPRASVRRDLARVWRPLGRIPDRLYERALAALPIPAFRHGDVRLHAQPDACIGWIILIPLSARQMLQLPRPLVVRRVEAALDTAVRLGAELVGLGALTATVTRGGELLQHRSDVGVTNGNAFTALVTLQAIGALLGRLPQPDPLVAVVGATGSVGSCVVRLLAQQRQVTRLLLVARDQGRLAALAAELAAAAPDVAVRVGDMAAVRQADLVVLLTSAHDSLLGATHLKPGAVVLDDTQPRNTDPSLPVQRPDVTVVDGGMVAVPGIALRSDIDLPRGVAYACLAETILLGLAGHRGHFSIGVPSLAQVEQVGQLARQYGFHLAPMHSFGRPLPASQGAGK